MVYVGEMGKPLQNISLNNLLPGQAQNSTKKLNQTGEDHQGIDERARGAGFDAEEGIA